jgi:tRNA(adenine34) deaminase
VRFKKNHQYWMRQAIDIAKQALPYDVPIGCLLLGSEGQLLAQGCNQREKEHLLTGHAEILAINEASKTSQDWRLTDSTLYVTLEPCLMCAGAIFQSKISTVIFGAYDLQAGAMGSVQNLIRPDLQIIGGILEEECASLLKTFFASRREN